MIPLLKKKTKTKAEKSTAQRPISKKQGCVISIILMRAQDRMALPLPGHMVRTTETTAPTPAPTPEK